MKLLTAIFFAFIFSANLIGCSQDVPEANKIDESKKEEKRKNVMGNGDLPMPKNGNDVPGLN